MRGDSDEASLACVNALRLAATSLLLLSGCAQPAPPLAAPPSVASSAALASPPAIPKMHPYPDNHPGSVSDTLFGTLVKDPYRWLEDEKAPAVNEWMAAQDAFARGRLKALPERDALAARLKELMYVDDLSAPSHRGSRYFFTRRSATQEKSVVYFKEGKAGAERVLLDPNTWSADGSTSLGNWTISLDGKKVAYTVHENNEDEATLHVIDVGSGTESKIDTIAGAKYAAAAWNKHGDGFYYTWLPTDPAIAVAERPGYAEVRFHRLGTDPKSDLIVHEKTGDPSQFIGAATSQDGSTLFLSIQKGWQGNEVYFKDLQGNGPFVPLATGFSAHYSALAYQGSLYVTTDEGAPRWRVFKVDPKRPTRGAWQELIAEDAHATLDDASVLGGKLALTYLDKATTRLEIHSLDGRLERVLALPGIGTAYFAAGRQTEDEAYLGFQSFTTPFEVHELSMKTGKTSLYSQVKVPVDASRFVVEQVTYPSKDGTPITMFIVHAKDLQKNGQNRTLLYGYGGFQVSLTPAFAASIFPWLERGGIYVVANLRGGSEYGETWHEAGMRHQKQNVFDDFAAAAEYLIQNKYTSPAHLAIAGASNGGLLTGATLVQRPELFSAVLCGVPLLDMVRYEHFGSGRTWSAEYGSVENEADFRTLLAYSPYHHVTAGARYPALLLLSADHDDRVDPMHARKFAAAVQDASTGGPVLLRIERHSGHGGADLRRAEVEKGADRFAFALYYTSGAPNAP
ncbi:MAG: prolyl oligopeptidase family serine peptidase [Polyangiaceae bacterium]